MKKTLIIIAATLLAFASQAQQLTSKQIERNAAKFACQMKQHEVQLQPVKLPLYGTIHIYNIEGGGYVIAGGDARTREILGYSATGYLSDNDMPANMLYWLKEYESQIAQLGEVTLEELYAAGSQIQPKDGLLDSVSALLQTEWRQYGHGYNSLTPFDSVIAADTNMDYFEGHPTVGCGALAMAQIMRFWQFPQHGYSRHSYSREGEYDCWRYGTLSADFANTTYDYENMPVRLTDSSSDAEVLAVATLASHCGIAANMAYNSDCNGSSGSQITACIEGMQRYFHYTPNVNITAKPYFTESQWISMLKNDLSAGRPVFYCGQSYEDEDEGTLAGGHAFVFDGYDTNDYFHVNWGWGGSCNGYYSVSVLRPMTQYDFTSYQYCAFGLEPSYNPIPILTMSSDLVLDYEVFPLGSPISGHYGMTNEGESEGNLYFGINIYNAHGYNDYQGCVDGFLCSLQAGDTINRTFSYDLNLPVGDYFALMQYSDEEFYAGIPYDQTWYYMDPLYVYQVPFSVRYVEPDTTGGDTTTVDTTEVGIRSVSQTAIRLFPNPAGQFVMLQGIPTGTPLRIYDMLGQCLLACRFDGTPIDIAQLPAGTYLLATSTSKAKLIKK